MNTFTPFTYTIDSSMMSLFSQLILMLIDLRVYPIRFLYANSIIFKPLHIAVYCSHFQSDKMTIFSLILIM